MARVSCPSVKLRVPGDFLTLVCPCLPLQPLLAGWEFPHPLLVPVASPTAIAGGFFFPRGSLRHATLVSSSRKLIVYFSFLIRLILVLSFVEMHY